MFVGARLIVLCFSIWLIGETVLVTITHLPNDCPSSDLVTTAAIATTSIHNALFVSFVLASCRHYHIQRLRRGNVHVNYLPLHQPFSVWCFNCIGITSLILLIIPFIFQVVYSLVGLMDCTEFKFLVLPWWGLFWFLGCGPLVLAINRNPPSPALFFTPETILSSTEVISPTVEAMPKEKIPDTIV